ncbi:hypothetical protein HPSH_05070 [Helicobacter pylori Shi470]|nr:hypothetical protein HPSH_05070 [Helicobacter pylori Shi470]
MMFIIKLIQKIFKKKGGEGDQKDSPRIKTACFAPKICYKGYFKLIIVKW